MEIAKKPATAAVSTGDEDQGDQRQTISRMYLDGRYDECEALVIDSLSGIANEFIKPVKREIGSMFGQARSQSVAKTRLMHQCDRKADCECVDLIVFYLTLLHHTGQTGDDIGRKLEAVQVHEPEKRLPFKALLTWAQLEMYLGRLDQAERLINTYVSSSTSLSNPKRQRPLGKLTKDDDDNNSDDEEGKDELFSTQKASTVPTFNFDNIYRGGGSNSSMFQKTSTTAIAASESDLPLASFEYYQLVELLIFQIVLPRNGMKDASVKLEKLPMPARIRTEFEVRLSDLRNMVVADVKLTQGEDVTFFDNNQAATSDEKKPTSSQARSTSAGDDIENYQQFSSQSASPSLQQQASSQQQELSQALSSSNALVEALVPKTVRTMINRLAKLKKRLGSVLLCLALLTLLYTMYRKGLITALAKTKLARAIIKLLFNYDMPPLK